MFQTPSILLNHICACETVAVGVMRKQSNLEGGSPPPHTHTQFTCHKIWFSTYRSII